MDLTGVLQRIDKRLKVVELSAWKASKLAGLSPDAIRNLQRAAQAGKEGGANSRTIAALAPVLRTNVGWLLDGSGPEEGDAVRSVVDVPLISWVSAGQLREQDAVIDLSDFTTVSAVDLPDGDWIALSVDGPSMNKISPPESVVFVNRRDKRLVANACYIIADETGAATYKRYRPGEKPPFQPASYEDVPPPKLEGAITIIGRVRRSVINM